ncbi:hypothetical protein FACS1894211_01400 [Clostridia bacterium]|nr:hypothetical protein FACS1894211_01400 [Clostridia bacterium]
MDGSVKTKKVLSGKGQLLIVFGIFSALFLGVFFATTATYPNAVKDVELAENGEHVVGKVVEARKAFFGGTSTSRENYYLSITVKHIAESGIVYEMDFRSCSLKEESMTEDWINSYIGRDWGLIIDPNSNHCIADTVEDTYFKEGGYDSLAAQRNKVTAIRIVKYISLALMICFPILFVLVLILLLKSRAKEKSVCPIRRQ